MSSQKEEAGWVMVAIYIMVVALSHAGATNLSGDVAFALVTLLIYDMIPEDAPPAQKP